MSGKTILLVEDKDSDRSQLLEELKSLRPEFRYIVASDGLQAFQKSRNQSFDVIFTKFNPPKLFGPSLVKALREPEHNEKTPLLIYDEDVEYTKNLLKEFSEIEILANPSSFILIANKIASLANKDDSESKRFRLDVDFVNPFIDTAVKTLKDICKIQKIEADKTLLWEGQELNIDISATLAITSPYFKGSIALSFNEKIYQKLVQELKQNKIMDTNADKKEGASEILKILFEQTKLILQQQGYALDRAVPSVVIGKNHKIYHNSKIPVLLVPFKSNAGEFFIQICVKAT